MSDTNIKKAIDEVQEFFNWISNIDFKLIDRLTKTDREKRIIKSLLKILTNLRNNFYFIPDLPDNQLLEFKDSLNKFRNSVIKLTDIFLFTEEETRRNPDFQKKYDDFYSCVQNILNVVRNNGLYGALVEIPEQVTRKNGIFEVEKEIKSLLDSSQGVAKDLKELLPEAVAGSLSNSLENRAKKLQRSKGLWLSASIIIMGSSLTIYLLYRQEINTLLGTEEYWLKRIATITPLVYLLVFCVRNYNKSTKLYEIYKHKSTIAQCLPAYISQASGETMKDSILQQASEIIFSLPENPEASLTQDSNTEIIPKLLEIIKSKS